MGASAVWSTNDQHTSSESVPHHPGGRRLWWLRGLWGLMGLKGLRRLRGMRGLERLRGLGRLRWSENPRLNCRLITWCDGIRWVLVPGATVVLTTRIRWVLVEEEEILFCFLYVRRTVWFFIRKPLPTQTWASSTVEEEFFPFSLEEEILFCFFYIRRTVWCSIRKPLPTQTRASSSVEEEEFFSFLFGRRNNILLFLCM